MIMSERQRDTAFLTQLLCYDAGMERQRMEERVGEAQSNEQCIRRAVWLMCQFVALSLAGFAYTVLLLRHLPADNFDFVIKLFGVLGLGSLISVVVFSILWIRYRTELDERREECRCFIRNVLESRIGQPGSLSSSRKVSEIIAGHTNLLPASCEAREQIELAPYTTRAGEDNSPFAARTCADDDDDDRLCQLGIRGDTSHSTSANTRTQ
jgi:hypothetical protein